MMNGFKVNLMVNKNIELYYMRDNGGKPYAAVAVEKMEDKVCRGIAVCSKKDAFVKEKGRYLALLRMNLAKENLEDKFPVGKYHGKHAWMPKLPFEKLAYYKDDPTEYEKKLFDKDKERNLALLRKNIAQENLEDKFPAFEKLAYYKDDPTEYEKKQFECSANKT